MRFDKALWRTVLFSLTVVLMVIGVYQTLLQNDQNAVRDDYWLFTFAFSFYLIYWYLGRKEQPVPPPATKPATSPANSRKPKSARKKR